MSVVIYTTPTCGYCQTAKKFLSQRGVPFVEKDVSRDPAAAQEMVQRSGQRGVPVIVVDGEVVVGFNLPLLEQLLSRRPLKLGVSVADAAKMRERYSLSVNEGAVIGAVRSGSLAAQSGLQTGDVIVQIGGHPIRTAQDVTDVLARGRGLGEVPIVWVRGEQKMQARLRF